MSKSKVTTTPPAAPTGKRICMHRALEKLDSAVAELQKLDAPPPPWKGLAAWRTRMRMQAAKHLHENGPLSTRRGQRK